MRILRRRHGRLTVLRSITLIVLPITAVDACSDSKATAPPVAALTTVSVSLESGSIEVGQIVGATAAGLDQTGAPIATWSVTWSSDDPRVASVGQDGAVLGVSPGTTRIVARSDVGVTGRRAITVAATPAIRINEVQPRGDASDGWIELVNLMPSAIDISGWMLFGPEFLGPHFTFPAGTTIPGAGHLVVKEDSLPFEVGTMGTVSLFTRFGVPATR